MTEEEIENMVAGSEMDRLIAMKVMGWEHDPEVPYYDTHDKNGELIHVTITWSPSTDIYAAWEVVEKMSTYADAFDGNENIWSSFVDELHGTMLFVMGREWAARQICRAALLAVK